MRDLKAPIIELRRDFGLDAITVEGSPGGFESKCWVVDGKWFVKVWHDDRHPVDLALLDRLADAGLPVPRPVRSDVLRTERGHRYAVFPYVRGRHATGDDWRAVARGLRRIHDVPVDGLGLPSPAPTDEPLVDLRARLDHPWIAARADELSSWLDRFEVVVREAGAKDVPQVLSHDDFGGDNLLLNDEGAIVAMLDWDWARLGPREHDLWLVIDEPHPSQFLATYGPSDLALDRSHLEFGLLRRALGDLAARVVAGRDRPGITAWGFDRLRRIDATLKLFA